LNSAECMTTCLNFSSKDASVTYSLLPVLLSNAGCGLYRSEES
jgi:hypothetical protein